MIQIRYKKGSSWSQSPPLFVRINVTTFFTIKLAIETRYFTEVVEKVTSSE